MVVRNLDSGRQDCNVERVPPILWTSKTQIFKDINKEPRITDALYDLYEDPDMVELYPGLMCEGDGRCLDPGTVGINSSPTALWAGVFYDAVTLVRFHRLYTVVSVHL